MEYGSIEREIRIDAAPEIVFDVVSDPAHVQQWWPDEAHYEAVPGSAGEIVFGNNSVAFQVVDAIPHRLFSFRWTHPEGEQAREGNSFLVTFELEPSGDGTLLRMTETGFRERGWEAAVLEQAYQEHCTGWDYYLPRLAPYVATHLAAMRWKAVDDALWSAVGDPTRRRMLDLLLAAGGGTATTLSAQLPVTRQAVAKHLVVLDRAGLVHGTTAGREKHYRVDSAQLARAVAQLAEVGTAWDRRLRRIKEISEAISEKARSHPDRDEE